MRYLLLLPIIVYTIGDTFRVGLAVGPGLSLKNAAVYIAGAAIVVRMVVKGGYRFELPALHACFGILIAYAVFSVLVAGLIVRYDGYQIVDSAIALKSQLIDSAIILGLFFYGTSTIRDGVFLTKALVTAVTIANIICIASIRGYVDIPGVAATPSEGGRVSGAFGHPNETAALLAAMLPAYVAIARSSRGLWPLLCIFGAMSSIAMLFMTASRGAFLGMLVGYPWAAYVFRRYVSWRQILSWSGALIALGAVILSLLGTHFISLFFERIVTQSGASDVGLASSGRSFFWLRALEEMMANPVTIITGFGWNVYSTMGFIYGMHNQYLEVWFELGLVGLCSFAALLLRTLWTVRSVVDSANPFVRIYLMAFVFGFGAFLITLFFGAVYQPWTYMWAYAGVSLRMALIAVEAKTSAPTSAVGGKRAMNLRNRSVPARNSRIVDASSASQR